MNKKNILVVISEKPLLMTVKSKLESEGYNVLCAKDVAECEEMMQGDSLDLVLAEIILSENGRLEILETVHEKNNKVPIIGIMNPNQTIDAKQLTNFGVVDYVAKEDFDVSDIIGKIEKVLGPNLSKQMPGKISKEDIVNKDYNKETNTTDGLTVLVIEDDEFLREVISQKLNSEGFKIVSTIDAAGAFKEIDKKKPHVILLDLILPGMDGFEFLSRIKQDSAVKDIPVVVLSNLGQKEDIERAMSAGATDYMIKANFTPAEIVQKVKDVAKDEYLQQ